MPTRTVGNRPGPLFSALFKAGRLVSLYDQETEPQNARTPASASVEIQELPPSRQHVASFHQSVTVRAPSGLIVGTANELPGDTAAAAGPGPTL